MNTKNSPRSHGYGGQQYGVYFIIKNIFNLVQVCEHVIIFHVIRRHDEGLLADNQSEFERFLQNDGC